MLHNNSCEIVTRSKRKLYGIMEVYEQWTKYIIKQNKALPTPTSNQREISVDHNQQVCVHNNECVCSFSADPNHFISSNVSHIVQHVTAVVHIYIRLEIYNFPLFFFSFCLVHPAFFLYNCVAIWIRGMSSETSKCNPKLFFLLPLLLLLLFHFVSFRQFKPFKLHTTRAQLAVPVFFFYFFFILFLLFYYEISFFCSPPTILCRT